MTFYGRRLWLLLAATCLVAALLWWRGAPESTEEALRPVAREAAETTADLPAPEAGRPDVPGASRGPLPRSLEGTSADGDIQLDAQGRLVPGPGLLLLFDHFLSASGEVPLPVIRGRILLELRERLPESAAAEAEALLDRYLDYRNALRALVESRVAPHELERRLQWVRELRREHFDAETAESLFGQEEAVTLLDLERRRVLSDPSLDDDERARHLADIDDRLPTEVREVRHRAAAPARLRREIEALRAAGASEAEVFAVREREFGAEGARRLAILDRERAAWQRRLDGYRVERDALLAGRHPQTRESRAALASLRAEHFEPSEIPRVRTLDALDLETGSD